MTAVVDPVERVADLIREVGRTAQEARRYRALVTSVADPAFERALAIGTVVRQSLRDPERQRAEAAAAALELQTVLDGCQAAIADLQRSAVYAEALAALGTGASERLAQLAPAIFHDVEPFPNATLLYWPVPIAGRRPGAHFLPPVDCAAQIAKIATEGLLAASPPPELGADDRIPAIVLADEHEVGESPLALMVDARAFPAPLCRLASSNVALFYAARVRLPIRVRTAAAVDDEWWSIRPDAYRKYIDDLAAALATAGITVRGDD